MERQPLQLTLLATTGLILVLAATFAVYTPGFSGSFLLDDHIRLNRLGDLGSVNDISSFIHYLNNAWSGPLGRPLALTSFLIDHNTWPAPAGDFKYTNTLFHLLNGCLLFALVFRLLKSHETSERRAVYLALFVAGAWLLHPFLVSTTLYVVQRMTILAAGTVLAGLLGYVVARESFPLRPYRALTFMTLSLGGAGCIGFLFKEIAALIVPLTLVLEATILPALFGNTALFRRWRTIVLVIPTVVLVGYLIWRAINGLGGIDGRDFNSIERVLTQTRLLFQYLFFWFVPQGTYPGLVNEEVEISRGLFSPITTLFSVFGIALLSASTIVLRRRFPILAASVGFFLVGHLLESTTIPLEIYFEHRNYLPSALLWLPIGLVCIRLFPSPRTGSTVLVLVPLTLAPITYFRASTWGDPVMLGLAAVEENPKSQRAYTLAAIGMNSEGLYSEAESVLRQGLNQLPGDMLLAMHLAVQQCNLGGVPSETWESIREAATENDYRSRQYPLVERFVETADRGTCDSFTPDRLREVLTVQLERLDQSQPDYFRSELNHLLGMVALQGNLYCEAYHRFRRSGVASSAPGLAGRQSYLLAQNGYYVEALQHISAQQPGTQGDRRGWRPIDSGIDETLTRVTRNNIYNAWEQAGRPPIKCAPLPLN